jgi:serine/threonine protein kinase
LAVVSAPLQAEPGLFETRNSAWTTPPHVQKKTEVVRIPPEFLALRNIGEGTFAHAVLAKHKGTGEQVVLKIAKQGSPGSEKAFRREVDLLKRSGNAVEGFFQDPETGVCAIAMKPVTRGPASSELAVSLLDIMLEHENGRQSALPEPYRITAATLPAWRAAMEDSLAELHAKGIIHSDVKPDNMLVSWDSTGKPVVRMIDLGLASGTEESQHGRGAGLFQGNAKLDGNYSKPLESDRFGLKLSQAFLEAVVTGEKPTVLVHVVNKPSYFPPSVAKMILEEYPGARELKPPPPERAMSARQKQMLCEAHYAALSVW